MESRDARALHQLVDLLDHAGVPYSIGGSIASSYFGEPRSTADVDMLVDLPWDRIPTLTAALTPSFYYDEPSIRDAVSRHGTFQALHLETYTKFDLFVAGGSELDADEMATRVLQPLGDGTARKVLVASPETVVIRKLDWLRRGGGLSDRQWADVLGVLKRQGASLDVDRMRSHASRMGLDALLDRALDEAGLH